MKSNRDPFGGGFVNALEAIGFYLILAAIWIAYGFWFCWHFCRQRFNNSKE